MGSSDRGVYYTRQPTRPGVEVGKADVNCTDSRLTDNQFVEANSYSSRTAQPEDDYNLGAEFGPSLFDNPHRFNFNVIVELPFGAGKKWASTPGVVRTIVGGWRITGVGRYSSGFPMAIWQSQNNSGLFGNVQRPNVASGIDPATSGSTEDRQAPWLNPAAWTPAAPFTLGDAPHTDDRVRTPTQKNLDMAFERTVPFGTKRLIVRIDALNILDNPLFLGPVTTVGTSNVGLEHHGRHEHLRARPRMEDRRRGRHVHARARRRDRPVQDAGVCYVRRDVQDRVWPLMGPPADPKTGARKYEEFGQREVPDALGLGAAIDLQNAIGKANVEARDRALSGRLRAGLKEVPGASSRWPTCRRPSWRATGSTSGPWERDT